MHRYRRTSVENWGWPPLLSNEKPLFLPISYKENAGKFFDTNGKKAYPIEKPEFCKRKTKDIGTFFVSKWRLLYTDLEKSLKIVAKSSLIEKEQTFDSIISSCIVGMKIVRHISHRFVFFDKLNLSIYFNECFLFYPILHCSLFKKLCDIGFAISAC